MTIFGVIYFNNRIMPYLLARRLISIILLLITTLFVIMIPHGPLEKRDFSNIPFNELLSFYLFISGLTFVSVVINLFIIQNTKWSFIVTFLCGLAYLNICSLDLANIYPVSYMDKGLPQKLIEIACCVFSLVLMNLSLKCLVENHLEKINIPMKNKYVRLSTITLGLLGLLIIVFVTFSAIDF